MEKYLFILLFSMRLSIAVSKKGHRLFCWESERLPCEAHTATLPVLPEVPLLRSTFVDQSEKEVPCTLFGVARTGVDYWTLDTGCTDGLLKGRDSTPHVTVSWDFFWKLCPRVVFLNPIFFTVLKSIFKVFKKIPFSMGSPRTFRASNRAQNPRKKG